MTKVAPICFTRMPGLWTWWPRRDACHVAFHVRGCSSWYQLSVLIDAALRGDRVVVDEHEERDLLVLGERFGVTLVAGADRDDVAARGLDVVVAVAQLHRVLTAVQATEVAQEHEHDRLVVPEVAEPVLGAGGVGERGVGKRGEIHDGKPTYRGSAGSGARQRRESGEARGTPGWPGRRS